MSERTIGAVKKKNIPELLAPAGGWEQLEAAVNNGADAVYMGGPFFNARMKADNFGGGRLKEAIDFAHAYGVKVYITLNTLIRESELKKAFNYACDLYEAGADAVILQDMGLARLIHKYLPDFPMHLSTQGTVYNRSGLEMAADLGFSRVVPARELSLEEIKRLCDKSAGRDWGCRTGHAAAGSTEVEVFVHGALCMCYSGQCQMSRLLGGGYSCGEDKAGITEKNGSARSGNRGLCAQPCRLPYKDDKGEISYALSPKDICTIEDIPALCEAGVDSFKIEGRLKSPEYVATVTRIYRKYLDMYAAGQQGGDNGRDIHDLLQIFNRGGFTRGYLYDNPEDDILSGSSPKNMGVCAGEVVAVHNIRCKSNSGGSQNGGSKGGRKNEKENRKLIDVKLAHSPLTGMKETIGMGDGIELSETGNVVTYMKEITGDIVRIGDFKTDSLRTIHPGEKVHKVTDRELNERALSAAPYWKSCDLKEESASRPHNCETGGRLHSCETEGSAVRNSISMKFTARTGRLPVLIAEADGRTFEIKDENRIEKALRRPSDPERIREQLAKLGGTPFTVSETDVRIDKEAMVPVSLINEMRRRAVNEIIESRKNTGRHAIGKDVRLRAEKEIYEGAKETYGGAKETYGGKTCCNETGETAKKTHDFTLVPLEEFLPGKYSEDFVPYVINVSKGEADRFIEENFERIAEAAVNSGIAIGNLGWIREFRDAGVKIYGDYGLNVFNSQAAELFRENGIEIIAWSDELSTSGRHCTVADCTRCQSESDSQYAGSGMTSHEGIVTCDAPKRLPEEMNMIPLMVTEHPFQTGCLTDRKGVRHKVMKWYSGDKYLIF